MEEIRVTVPDGFADLIADETIERGALRSLAKKRLAELEADREEAERHVGEFEDEYGMDFEEFEGEFEDDATKEAHEDYNEWYFWRETRERTTKRIERVQNVEQ
jgi:broad specificity phosphatase PhoE